MNILGLFVTAAAVLLTAVCAQDRAAALDAALGWLLPADDAHDVFPTDDDEEAASHA